MEAEAAKQREEAARLEAAKRAKELALELVAKLPKAVIKTEAQIFAEAAARKCRRMLQRRGENFARSAYLRDLKNRLSEQI